MRRNKKFCKNVIKECKIIENCNSLSLFNGRRIKSRLVNVLLSAYIFFFILDLSKDYSIFLSYSSIRN